MKNLDLRSVIIGILSSALIFTLYGLRFQDENLGDIKVESLTVRSGGYLTLLNNEGDLGIILSTNTKYPFISIFNSDSKEAVAISSDKVGNGNISTYSNEGSKLVTIAANVGQSGSISTYSNDGTNLVAITASEGDNGTIVTNSSSGNKLIEIDSNEGNPNGYISVYNKRNKEVVSIQGNQNDDGVIGIFDRYGDLGWGKSGKK